MTTNAPPTAQAVATAPGGTTSKQIKQRTESSEHTDHPSHERGTVADRAHDARHRNRHWKARERRAFSVCGSQSRKEWCQNILWEPLHRVGARTGTAHRVS